MKKIIIISLVLSLCFTFNAFADDEDLEPIYFPTLQEFVDNGIDIDTIPTEPPFVDVDPTPEPTEPPFVDVEPTPEPTEPFSIVVGWTSYEDLFNYLPIINTALLFMLVLLCIIRL